jgi:hypothetical protein
MSRRSDNDLTGVLHAERLWIIRHDGAESADGANSLRRALQMAAELADAGHHVTSVRDPNARTIIEQHQIRRLLARVGKP